MLGESHSHVYLKEVLPHLKRYVQFKICNAQCALCKVCVYMQFGIKSEIM